MSGPAPATKVGPALCEFLGLDANVVTELSIHCAAGEMPTAHVTMWFPDTGEHVTKDFEIQLVEAE